MLKNYFDEVYTAKDGREALDLYYEKKPDVLLLDVTMPKMDGLEVAGAVRKEDAEIPIIMLTAHSEVEKLLRAVPLKLEAYLLKPVNTRLLQNTMLKFIQRIEEKGMMQLKEELFWNAMNESLQYRQEQVKLTIKETLLLQLLCRKPGEYFIRNTLIYHVWHDEMPDASHDKKLTKLASRFNRKIMHETDSATALRENDQIKCQFCKCI